MLHLSIIGSGNRRGVSSWFFCAWKTTSSPVLWNEGVWKINFVYQYLRGVCLQDTSHLHFAVRYWQLQIILWYSFANRINWYHLHRLVPRAIFKKMSLIFRLPLYSETHVPWKRLSIPYIVEMNHHFKFLTKFKVKVLIKSLVEPHIFMFLKT